MSSEEEDRNPKAKEQTKPGQKPEKVEEETTELDRDEEYDEEEDKNIRDNDNAINTQLTGITVKVDNPQLKDGGAFSKKYTVYDVIGKDKHGEFRVKRRYNEFNELRAKLLENWPGYFIPPIPEKKSTGNTTPEFVKQRQHMLNHFMERCAKMPHIFYSNELQQFLRYSGSDLGKHLASIKALTPTQMYERNKELFPEYDKELTEKVEKSVKKYFQTLESTIKFFNKFRANAKNLYAFRSKFKSLKTQFTKYAINDYKNKLKGDEVKKSVEDQFKEYQRIEREDDLSNFLQSLKDLELDLTSFFSIKEDMKKVLLNIDRIKKKQEEANRTLAKVRSQESEEVKDGLFKKMSKSEMVARLEKEIEECQADIDSLEKNRMFTFHLLNSHEFPILVNDKRTTFAFGVIGFANKRIEAIDKELAVIKMMHEHYRKY